MIMSGFLSVGEVTKIETSPRAVYVWFGPKEVYVYYKDNKTLSIEEIWTVNVSITQAQRDFFKGIPIIEGHTKR